MRIGLQMRSQRMRFVAIEDLRYCLAFVGSKGCDVDERFHFRVVDCCDHCTRVGVSGK
jgi:hypothetical protein